MKNTIITLAILLASMLSSFAIDYNEAMVETISKLNQAHNAEELVSLSNAFDRIGEKESSKWLPFYYASYSNLSVLFFESNLTIEEKEMYLKQAQTELDKAAKITNQESEIYILQAFIYQMSITNPSLGRKYSALANESLAKSQILNPNNPRYFYLKGTGLLHTPEQYGGGKTVAKPLFQKAKELFELQQDNTLLPTWGKQHNRIMLQQCE